MSTTKLASSHQISQYSSRRKFEHGVFNLNQTFVLRGSSSNLVPNPRSNDLEFLSPGSPSRLPWGCLYDRKLVTLNHLKSSALTYTAMYCICQYFNRRIF
ncbi:hypothetical protein AVEN_102885-1 [Araneus ventricosus]|uniref:Uncharacterized protein n=1 Tax=Araneus ventricosus TaxID=182803 RepID=A0A4Y2LZA8_ARAVE|nr:hypothetical protein AVEN_102885-1 [Araneus ventricosus]